MELSLMAAGWTCLLGAGLFLALSPAVSMTASHTAPRPPRLIGCVFLNRANVTCHWEAGDTPTTHYTLQVERIAGMRKADASIPNSPENTFTCNTSDTSCTAISGSSVRFTFCVMVTAHGPGGDISSQPRCQSGRDEVMLPPVTLNSVLAVSGSPQCLNVTWSRAFSVFPVSNPEIKAGHLKSQIEFTTAQGQLDVQVKNVTVTDYSFQGCHFRPDTSYTVRLRHHYRGPKSPWSLWSNALGGRTGEDAPSAAPAFWRRVKQTDKDGRRHISLLWKPLPRSLANGRVLFFNVTCRTEIAQVLEDHGTCRDLRHTSTSCSLLLPAGRCSCVLTASTSAGTSPQARIWFLGASETEPSPPRQITTSPLDDSSLDVRWMAPADWSTSGFVVEWFAVREKSRSILHWERLKNDSTALVITEGVKPMERYVVSVKALYGERGAGQNRTVRIYTRQGAPSAGPKVEVQQISGSTVELTWSPVPVEKLHGFIRNYTLCYTAENQPARRVFVSGHAHCYSLEKLLPGNYDIFMQANTDAGAGAAGPIANVHIGSEENSIVIYALPSLMLTSLALVLMAFLSKNRIVKQKLCQDVPDPSRSSLAHWTPKTTLESIKWPRMAEKTEIKYSKVVLPDESELQQNSDLQAELQTYYCHHYSLLPASGAQTPHNIRKPERKCNKSSTVSDMTYSTALSSCPSIYSNVLLAQTLKSLPTPSLPPSFLKSNDWQRRTASVNDVWLQLGGDSEPCVSLRGGGAAKSDSSLSQTDELKTSHHFEGEHQSPLPLSDYCIIAHPSVFLSPPAEVTSPQRPFPQSLCHSVQPLQRNNVT